MPIAKEHKPKVAKKKEKVDMGRAEYMKLEAERTRAEKAKRAEEAERKRVVNEEKALLKIKEAAKREKLVSELTDEDGPKLVSKVVGKALGIPKADTLLPKDVLDAAAKQMSDVDIAGLAPKAALLKLAEVIVERKAAKAAKEAAKKAAKDKEKADKLAAVAAAKAAKEAAEAQEVRATALQNGKTSEPEPEVEGGARAEFGCVNAEIPDLAEDDGKPAMSAKEKRLAKKLSKKDSKKGGKKKKEVEEVLLGADGQAVSSHQRMLEKMRAVTGNLASRAWEMDVKIDKFTMSFAGPQLIGESTIELNQGCRYGLLGNNGAGKTNLINALALREVPIPEHIDMFHLDREAEPTDRSAVESVVDHVVAEAARLEKLADDIMEKSGPEDERLASINDRLDELDPATFETNARKVLSGLGFHETMTVPMERKTKHMSGGWRMRVSLAQALFSAPSILLLDEPTNHLDLEACVWLENFLAGYKKCLMVVSHSQDFLNTVCNRIIWLTEKTLRHYTGNYSTFCQLKEAEYKVQLRQWEKQKMDIEKLEDYIRKNSANKKTYKSAQSKQKVLDKILLEAVKKPSNIETDFKFRFNECHRLASPVLPFDGVSFAYNGIVKGPEAGTVLFRDLDLGVDCDSRIALVGPNGSGKSTLLKLMAGELSPTEGTINRKSGLVLGRYHQHSEEMLDMELTALEFFPRQFDTERLKKMGMQPMSEETWRAFLGNFGISGKLQQTQMGKLSDGQKSRLIFAIVSMCRPNILLLDEPTNHLDVGAIDALARIIHDFDGGCVVVSHDFRLIDQVAKIIWECTGPVEGATIKVWPGTIHEYKKKLAAKMQDLMF